jgi:hypothetical protein
MRVSAGLLSCLIFAGPTWACQSNDLLLPSDASKRQKSLSDRILDRGLRPDPDPATQEDIALALSEVVITGHAPKLRLIVTNGSPTLAKGAARALARIRVLRESDRQKTLQECAKSETNAFVAAECSRLQQGDVAPAALKSTKEIVSLLESDDPERRRSGLRQLLASSLATAGDERLESALYHRLDDPDARVRVLTSAVFLRRSLVTSPFATEESAR